MFLHFVFLSKFFETWYLLISSPRSRANRRLAVNYDDLFAPSCGSVGEFTDIREDAEGNLAITSEMQCYSFPVGRLTGEFYAQVYPFDTKFFRKVHPAGALLFSGIHSHLMLLQYLLIHLPKAKQPLWVLSEVPKYWLEDDGAMCLDEAHRWRSKDTIAWLRTHGLYSVPSSIKAEIGDLVYNPAKSRASCDPPPGLFWTMMPMSRRLNREFCADIRYPVG